MPYWGNKKMLLELEEEINCMWGVQSEQKNFKLDFKEWIEF
jgi:hypothetical protein